jgi:hypothetical protein
MTDFDTARSRLRFESVNREATQNGRCLVTVTLEWSGELHQASVTEFETPQGIIKAASKAALQAVVDVAQDVDLEMVGVKAVRAFDGWVVVTRLNRNVKGDVQRLLGAAPCEEDDDLPAAAVMAVLDASNRIFGHAMTQSGSPTE